MPTPAPESVTPEPLSAETDPDYPCPVAEQVQCSTCGGRP